MVAGGAAAATLWWPTTAPAQCVRSEKKAALADLLSLGWWKREKCLVFCCFFFVKDAFIRFFVWSDCMYA